MTIRANNQAFEAASADGALRVSNKWWRWLSSQPEGAPA
jgi:hypothetical protein